ncbi:MAG: LPS export ABC transporter permease LptG [bacterium]|nr:LPS export ABC transporter permease LptG [bacterium]
MNRIERHILDRYLLRSFASVFGLCLLGSVSLFIIFDLFDRMRIFMKEGATVFQAVSYVLFKIPLIVHLMLPVAIMVSTLITLGRLSQLSEVTAMRSCGLSIIRIARPLFILGFIAAILALISSETIVPWSQQRLDDLYHIQIRKKVEKGVFNRENFWYRDGKHFLNIGVYESRTRTIRNLSVLQFDKSFALIRRIDAESAIYVRPEIGWVMKNVTEIEPGNENNNQQLRSYNSLPLVLDTKPKDFYLFKQTPESMSISDIWAQIQRFNKDGVSTTRSYVELFSKTAFPLLNFIVVIISVPFAITSVRSGTMTLPFVGAVAVGFGYYFIHALSVSFGMAELLPVVASAWAANILFLCLGGYLLAGVEAN